MIRPFTLLVSFVALAAAALAADSSLRVRSSAVAAPCVEAAARAWSDQTGLTLSVETGGLRDEGRWDVLVGSGVEITRALEGGDAVIDSDVDIAKIPWVLQVSGGGEVKALSDVVRSGTDILMPAGPASYEARRALAQEGIPRVRETTDPAQLRSAPLALVPVSLAGPGRKLEVEVPPIPVIAAVGLRSRFVEDATGFVRYLGSETGQDVFAACGAAAPAQ